MFARVTRIRKLTSLLAVALMLVAGVGFARATSAHTPGLTMAVAAAPCDHGLSDGTGSTEPMTTALDVCAALCKASSPDALAVSVQTPQKTTATLELPNAVTAVHGAARDVPLVRDARPTARLRHPPPKPSLVTSRRLLI
ncbi:MAG: hypothetical protein SFV19_10815 [Rhodospirillaceae bacterium]|nr:hypothetical protein [Rhodospirillaceae bacterium]